MQGAGRFALEVAFLIALAVGTGVAELSAATIVVVMALAWLLVCLFELTVWAEDRRFPAFERREAVAEEAESASAERAEEPEPAITEIRPPEEAGKRRFWRRRRAATG